MDGNIMDVAGTSPGYAALMASGADLDALMAEHLAATGPAGIRAMARAVDALPVQPGSHEAVEVLTSLESLRSVAGAKQCAQATALEDTVVADRIARGVREKNPAWGVRGALALALHLSPKRGTRLMNHAHVLQEDCPRTWAALRAGTITVHQSEVVTSGVRHLQAENRQMVDELLWEQTHTCFEAGDAKLREIITQWALILEPATEADLEEKAHRERYVDIYQIDAHRVKITGMLPLEQGIPMLQVLARETGRAQETGDPRTGGQVAADTVFESVTGIKAGDSVPVSLVLVMPEENLTGTGTAPVLVPGQGYLSAAKARDLLAGNPDNPLDTWVRRLYTAPDTGDLVAMDSRARRFPASLKRFIAVRDQYCRTPYCNGRIEHFDHIVQVRRGGKTTVANASSRCRRCNATKEAPGWEERPVDGARHTFEITTPGGHRYTSTAPPFPGITPPSRTPNPPPTPPPRRQ